MNIKLITKAMHTLSLLSEEDVSMVIKLRGLSEDERQMLMLVLEPQKAAVKSTQRVIEHCAACDYTRRAKVHKDMSTDGYHEFQPSSKKLAGGGRGSSKSARASGMAAQLNAQLGNRRQESNSSVSKCTHQFDSGAMCFEPADANVHHMPTAPNYHSFQPAEQAAATGGN